MSYRIAKVNKQIQRIFGSLLQKEATLPKDTLVTIALVDTSKDLRSTKIWLSILPNSKTKTVMETLKPQMYKLQGALNKELAFHPLPRIKLITINGDKYTNPTEQALAEFNKQ